MWRGVLRSAVVMCDVCCVVMYGALRVAVLLVAIGSSVAIWLRRQEVEGAKAARQQEASEQPAVRARAAPTSV